MPNLYIIAGPNGAGKTTASYTILPKLLKCDIFVNADEIARGLSPLNPEKAAFEAGKLMLTQVKKNLKNKNDFAIETTLSTKYYLKFIAEAKSKGFTVVLVFLWLKSSKVAIGRVKSRVQKGGHNIPIEIIKRRYIRGLKNFKTFANEVNNRLIINNNSNTPYIVAEKYLSDKIKIHDDAIFEKIMNYEG